MNYAYYPGCSLHSTAKEYDISLKVVCNKLGIELVEPKNWFCCGSTPAHALSKLLSICLPYQNFIEIAKLNNEEVIVPCTACFSRFKFAQFELKENTKLKEEVEQIIGQRLVNELKIQHPLRIFSQESILNKIKESMQRDLSKLKIVCYYGCLLTRPPKVTQFDECEYPQSMDRILQLLGIQTLDWSYKTECCGAAFSLTRSDIVRKLCYEILTEAKEIGADAISVACPLCHLNLDSRQKEIENEYGKKFALPVFYFTQLIGIALGYDQKELGLNRHLVSTDEIFDKVKAECKNEYQKLKR